jgi:hypothetical protein
VSWAGGKIVVKESKSEHGYRTLPLKDTLMAAPARPVAKRRPLVPDRLVLCATRQLVRYLTCRTERRTVCVISAFIAHLA